MKKLLSGILCFAMLSLFSFASVEAADNKVYFKDDFETYDEGVEYNEGNPMSTDMYAVWGEQSNQLSVEKNSYDETYGKSFMIKRSALYSAWDLDKLFNTTEENVVIDMMIGPKAINSVSINGFFGAVGGDERGELRRLLWITDYNGRYVMKIAEEGVDSTIDLKKKVMNRITMVLKMDDQKNATVQLYVNGEQASEPVSVGIRSKSLLRFNIDGWTGGSGNEIYLDNLTVTGLNTSIDEFLAQSFEPGASGTVSTTPSDDTNNTDDDQQDNTTPTEAPATQEPAEEFKPEKDPNGNINVYIDGEKVEFDVPPMMMNERTMVPMRMIFEEIGATIDWNQDTQTVIGRKGDNMVKIVIGSDTASINGDIVALDQPAVIVDERTLVPIRVVSEGLGLNVEWDQDTLSVIMTSK